MSTSAGFVLNAFAPEFKPDPDQRCLFLTFSNGFPLTQIQIFAFFNRMFPSGVEDVYVHKPRTAEKMIKPGLFGKVKFRSHFIPNLVMGPYEKVCFVVDGRPMYCRKFISQKHRTGNAAATLRDRPE